MKNQVISTFAINLVNYVNEQEKNYYVRFVHINISNAQTEALLYTVLKTRFPHCKILVATMSGREAARVKGNVITLVEFLSEMNTLHFYKEIGEWNMMEQHRVIARFYKIPFRVDNKRYNDIDYTFFNDIDYTLMPDPKTGIEELIGRDIRKAQSGSWFVPERLDIRECKDLYELILTEFVPIYDVKEEICD